MIKDASENENLYSTISDIYIGFNKELSALGLVNPDEEPREIPTERIDKATVVKAALYNKDGNMLNEIEAVYFVGYKGKKEYDEMMIVSIVTDPDDLFDYEKGIYVTGKEFDKYFSTLADFIGFNSRYIYSENYFQRGENWRRAADIIFFNPYKKTIESGTFEIAIQGGFNRSDIPRSLNIYVQDKKRTINGKALGFDYDITSLTLFAGGNERYTLLYDTIINMAVNDLCFASRRFVPCALFLEGEYWGQYFLTERYDAYYFQKKYGVNSKDVVLIKTSQVEIGSQSDLREWKDLENYIAANDMSEMVNYEYIKKHIDIESLVEYYATEIYIANMDWSPTSNFATWKSRSTSKRSNYDDGRWRYALYDVNISLDINNAQTCLIDRTKMQDPVFLSLMENVDFENQFNKKLVFLATVTFEPENMRRMITNYCNELLPAMRKHYSRFFGKKNIEDYTKLCEQMISYFQLRADYIIETYGVQ